jgi:hypothetical protein
VAGLRRGVPWYQIPEGLLPVQAMTQAAHDETPRRRSLVEDFLDRPDDQVVYHPIRGDEDES